MRKASGRKKSLRTQVRSHSGLDQGGCDGGGE